MNYSDKKINKLIEVIVQIIAVVVEISEPNFMGHQKGVSMLASFIVEEMYLSKEIIESIKLASLLHDIGKIKLLF